MKINKSGKARFKRRVTAVPNYIDLINFDFSATFKTKSRYCRVARQAAAELNP